MVQSRKESQSAKEHKKHNLPSKNNFIITQDILHRFHYNKEGIHSRGVREMYSLSLHHECYSVRQGPASREDGEINPRWTKAGDIQARSHLIYPIPSPPADLTDAFFAVLLAFPSHSWVAAEVPKGHPLNSVPSRKERKDPSSYNSPGRKSLPEAPSRLSHIAY